MNEFTDALLQYSYSPTINVYIAWIVGAYYAYKMQIRYNVQHKTFDDLSSDFWAADLEKKAYEHFVKYGYFNIWRIRFEQLGNIVGVGTLNDLIFIMIGGPQMVVYNRLWWGQFLPLSTIIEICC